MTDELINTLEETIATLLIVQIAWGDKFSENLSNMANTATKLGTEVIAKERFREEPSNG